MASLQDPGRLTGPTQPQLLEMQGGNCPQAGPAHPVATAHHLRSPELVKQGRGRVGVGRGSWGSGGEVAALGRRSRSSGALLHSWRDHSSSPSRAQGPSQQPRPPELAPHSPRGEVQSQDAGVPGDPGKQPETLDALPPAGTQSSPRAQDIRGPATWEGPFKVTTFFLHHYGPGSPAAAEGGRCSLPTPRPQGGPCPTSVGLFPRAW